MTIKQFYYTMSFTLDPKCILSYYNLCLTFWVDRPYKVHGTLFQYSLLEVHGKRDEFFSKLGHKQVVGNKTQDTYNATSDAAPFPE